MARRRRIRRAVRRRSCEIASYRLDRVLWELHRAVTALRDLGEDEAAGLVSRSHQRLAESRQALVVRSGRR